MAEGKIVRKGGVAATKTPTISLVSKDSESITFTITNNESATVDVFWEVGDNTPDANQLSLASETTSGNITASGLSDNTEYTIFTFSNAAGKAGSATASLTVTTDEIVAVTLGVEWDQDTDSLVRLNDAVGLTAGGDFDGFNHYQLRRCMVNDDLSINYYIDPTNPNLIGEVVNTGSYTTGGTANYTGSHGQVMVEIPKFWWKTDEPTSDQYQWRISDIAQSGYDVHPAFITNGVTKDYIYMSAFEGNVSSGLTQSISGVQPTTSLNAGTMRNNAQNRGTGWQVQTFWGTHALQLLYLVEYADFDSQTTIGQGVVRLSSRINTGGTISLGNASGSASGTDGEVSISYRGVENLWGNVFKFVDGLNSTNYQVYAANENFETDVYTGSYTLLGTISDSTGFASDILFPYFLPIETNGSDTSYLYDRFVASGGARLPVYGNAYNNFSWAGMFSVAMFFDNGSQDGGVSSRLQIL